MKQLEEKELESEDENEIDKANNKQMEKVIKNEIESEDEEMILVMKHV